MSPTWRSMKPLLSQSKVLNTSRKRAWHRKKYHHNRNPLKSSKEGLKWEILKTQTLDNDGQLVKYVEIIYNEYDSYQNFAWEVKCTTNMTMTMLVQFIPNEPLPISGNFQAKTWLQFVIAQLKSHWESWDLRNTMKSHRERSIVYVLLSQTANVPTNAPPENLGILMGFSCAVRNPFWPHRQYEAMPDPGWRSLPFLGGG